MSDYEDDDDDYGGSYSHCDYGGGGGGYSPPGYSTGGYWHQQKYGAQFETDSDDEEDHSILPSRDQAMKPNFRSYQAENTSKFHSKTTGEDGKHYSGKFSQAYKGHDFVDKCTGNPGFKEEVKYDLTYKVDDKVKGSITEYNTQVKTSKKVTITNPSSSSYKDDVPTIHSVFKDLNIK